MKKGGLWILVVLLLLVLFFVPLKSPTGFYVLDQPPVFVDANITVAVDSVLDISLYFRDPENLSLSFEIEHNGTITNGSNISFNISGEQYITAIVSDEYNTFYKRFPVYVFEQASLERSVLPIVEDTTNETSIDNTANETLEPINEIINQTNQSQTNETNQAELLEPVLERNQIINQSTEINQTETNQTSNTIQAEREIDVIINGKDVNLTTRTVKDVKSNSSVQFLSAVTLNLTNLACISLNASEVFVDTITCPVLDVASRVVIEQAERVSIPTKDGLPCYERPRNFCSASCYNVYENYTEMPDLTEAEENSSITCSSSCSTNPVNVCRDVTRTARGLEFVILSPSRLSTARGCPVRLNVSGDLLSDVSASGTCVSLNNDNVVLDCNGNKIFWNTQGYDDSRAVVAASVNNVSVRNCVLIEGNASGGNGKGILFVNVTNSTISDITVRPNGTGEFYALHFFLSNRNIVRDSTFAIFSSFQDALRLNWSNNNVFYNNTVIILSGTTSSGTRFLNQSLNNIFVNNTLQVKHRTGNSFLSFPKFANLSAVLSCIKVNSTIASLNTSRCPSLNVSARISFTDVNLTYPVPLYDLGDGKFVSCSKCTAASFKNNTFSFNVTSFSRFSFIEELLRSGNLMINTTSDIVADNGSTSLISFRKDVGLKSTSLSKLATCLKVNSSEISVNTTLCPELNATANLLIANTSGVSIPYRHGVPCYERPKNWCSEKCYDVNENNTKLGEKIACVNNCFVNDDNVCGNVSLTKDGLSFDVTGFSHYSVAPGCPVTINVSSELSQNVTTTGSCITFGSSNVELDCHGYTITYNLAGENNNFGVSAANKTNLTLRNCVLVDGNGTGTQVNGIVFNNVSNSIVVNVTVQQNGSRNVAGAFLSGSSGNVIDNSTIQSVAVLASNNALWENGSNNFVRNTLIAAVRGGSYGVFVSSNSSTGFVNVTLNNTNEWLSSNENGFANFTNITFRTGNGSIFVRNFTLVGLQNITQLVLNVSNNSAFIDTSNTTSLNTSSRITLAGISGIKIPARHGVPCIEKPKNWSSDYFCYDKYENLSLEQTENFTSEWENSSVCYSNNYTNPDNICTNISMTSEGLSFDVTGFSHYTAVSGCPATITVNSDLTQNLSSTAGCISFGASNIVLDCHGYAIEWNTAGGNNDIAVQAANLTNVTIMNCVLVDGNVLGSAGVGILLKNVTNSSVYNNTIRTNGTSNSHGINMTFQSYGLTIENNTVNASGTATTYAIELSAAYNNTIKGNLLESNSTRIVNMETPSFSDNNTFENNNFTSNTTATQITLFLRNNNNNVFGNTFDLKGAVQRAIAASSHSIIDNNTITINSSIAITGIQRTLLGGTNHTQVRNNMTIRSSSEIRGIAPQNAPILHNIITINSSTSSAGINYLTGSGADIDNNTINVLGNSSSGILASQSAFSAFNRLISNNTIILNGEDKMIGIALMGDDQAYYTSFSNNRINNNATGSFNYGIYIQGIATSGNNMSFTNDVISTRGNNSHAILTKTLDSNYTNINVTVTGNNSYAILFNGTGLNNLTNATLNVTGHANGWILLNSTQTLNFTNNTFLNNNGSIRINTSTIITTIENITQTHINITNNTAFINTTNLSMFNTTATITLYGITFVNPQPLFDAEDDGTYTACTSPQCTEISFTGNTFVFNVTRFSTYSTEETNLVITLSKTDNPDPLNLSNTTILNYTVTVNVTNGTAVNVTVLDFLPPEVTFVNSSPVNTSNNTWALGNLTSATTVNITVNVSSSLADGTLINNTANVTYLNGSNSLFSLQVVEQTNISNAAAGFSCPTTVATSTTLTANASATGSCVTFTASDIFLDCNGYTITWNTAGGNNEHAVLAGNRSNVTVRNCILIDGNISGSTGVGINFTNASNSFVYNNSIQTNGSANNYGINLQNGSNTNLVANNTVRTNGTGNSNYAIASYLSNHNNTITRNTVSTNGTGDGNVGIFLSIAQGHNLTHNSVNTSGVDSNYGIMLRLASNNTIVNNNTIQTGGTDQLGIGVYVVEVSSNNTVRNNTVITNGTTDNYGVALDGQSSRNLIFANYITTNGSNSFNYGLLLSNAHNNTLFNNTVSTSGTSDNHAVLLDSSGNNSFENNTLTTRARLSYGVLLLSSGDNNFSRTTFNATVEWVMSNNTANINNFTNTTFQTGNGSIRFNSTVNVSGIHNVSQSKLNITNNSAFVNSTNLSFLNTTAQIILNGITTLEPRAIVDPEDDGTLINCSSARCTRDSFVGTTFRFNVTSFTNYSTEEAGINISLTKTDNPDPINLTNNVTTLNYTLIVNVTEGNATNVTLIDFYPASSYVTFVNASPENNTNGTWNVGTLTNGSYIVNISVRVNSSLADGTIINNTANITYQNTTGHNRTIQITEQTTVSNSPLNISISKTDSSDPVTVGDTFTYSINVTNNGITTAYNTTLVESYPAQTVFSSSQPNPVAGTNNANFSIGNLTNGSSFIVNITVTASTAGTASNNATVFYYNNTGLEQNSSVVETTTINAGGAGGVGAGGGSGGAGGGVSGKAVAEVEAAFGNESVEEFGVYYMTSETFNKYLGEKERVRFRFKNDSHSLSVLKVVPEEVHLRVASTPMDFLMKENTMELLDIDDDLIEDLLIRVLDINRTKANLKLILLPGVQEQIDFILGEEEKEMVQLNQTLTERDRLERRQTFFVFGVMAGIIMILVLVVGVLLFRRPFRRPTPFTYMEPYREPRSITKLIRDTESRLAFPRRKLFSLPRFNLRSKLPVFDRNMFKINYSKAFEKLRMPSFRRYDSSSDVIREAEELLQRYEALPQIPRHTKNKKRR